MKAMLCSTVVAALVAVAGVNSALADNFKVHRYAAESWNVNSYWLESDSGIVLIDSLLLTTDANHLATLIEATGKPLAAAIITHDHTDHTGGLNTLIARLGSFPVIATQDTADHFEGTHKRLSAWVKDDYDPAPPQATQIVEDGAQITLAGIDFVIDDIGPGEGENNILIYVPEANILFSGDATNHNHHVAGLRTGRAYEILAQREYIKEKYGTVKKIYPGHGEPARPSAVLDAEIDYIEFRFELIEEALKSEENLDDDGTGLKEAVMEEMTGKVMARYKHLNDYGFDAVGLVNGSWPSLVKEVMAKN